MTFSTTLLREKFTIKDGKNLENAGRAVTAVSNRVSLDFKDDSGKISETFVIRSKMMHTTLRMASRIAQTYMRSGPLMSRAEKFDFEQAWLAIGEDHEKKFNSDNWVAVYNGGKIVYAANQHHAFLDMIENCDANNLSQVYDASVLLAEETFAKMGKSVKIDHNSNTGMVLTVDDKHAHCGMIFRQPNKVTTFSYIADQKNPDEAEINPPQCLTVAAAFLEGIQHAYHIGQVNEKLRLKLMERYCAEDKKAESARKKLARLNSEIRAFENNFTVKYRPEKPQFSQLILEAEQTMRRKHEKLQVETAASEDKMID